MPSPDLAVATAGGLYVRAARGKETIRFEGRPVIAVAGSGPRLWAIVEGREIWRRDASGSWRQMATSRRNALCLGLDPKGLLVGTDEAHLYRLHAGKLESVRSFEGSEGRTRWFTPWGGPPATRSISIGPSGTLFVNVHVGGVVRSEDGGASWRPTLEIETDVHEVLAHPTRPRVVLAASAVGLGVSVDAGDTWRFETRGFHALYHRAVALAGPVALVSASRSERGEEAAVYRRELPGEGPFIKCQAGLPEWFPNNVNTACIATAGAKAVIGAVDGTVYLSGDRGASWKTVRQGLPKINAVAFASG